MLSRSKRGHSRLNRPTTAPNIDLFSGSIRPTDSNTNLVGGPGELFFTVVLAAVVAVDSYH